MQQRGPKKAVVVANGRQPVREALAAGVEFWCLERDRRIVGVMGIQDRGDVVEI